MMEIMPSLVSLTSPSVTLCYYIIFLYGVQTQTMKWERSISFGTTSLFHPTKASLEGSEFRLLRDTKNENRYLCLAGSWV